MSLDLPPTATPEREQAIRDLVRQGKAEIYWAPVTSDYNGHHAEFQVFADALKLGGVRVNVSAETEQILADMLNCMLLTPKLADLIWLQRDITLPPFPRQITSSTAAMVEHSAKIEAAVLGNSNPYGLVCTVGKHWVIDNALGTSPHKAMNYGWHFAGSNYQGLTGEVCATLTKDPTTRQYLRLIQGRGTAHDMHHVDYSQTCVLVSKDCVVDGNQMTMPELLKDPNLANLASHQGVMKILRQPGVPEPA